MVSIKYALFSLVIAFATRCKDKVNPTTNNDNEVSVVQHSDAKKIATEDVEEIMKYLASDSLKGRDTGSEEVKLAADYLSDKLKGYGLQPFKESYLDTFEVAGTEAYNVVGLLPGIDPELTNEYIVIGAHYDHIGTAKEVNGDQIANGANDNAAGTAAVVLLAKHFATSKNNKRSLLFVLFGAEEKGLLGSKHLANRLKKENIDMYMMLNFEMIGVPLTHDDYKAYITGFETSNMAEKINEYSGTNLIGYLPKAKEYNLFRRSDNYSFFEVFKVPSQTISTFDFTNYDYYHHVDDEVSRVDVEFMASFIQSCIPALENIISTPTKEIQLK